MFEQFSPQFLPGPSGRTVLRAGPLVPGPGLNLVSLWDVRAQIASDILVRSLSVLTDNEEEALSEQS